jgi:hypothetical protein
MAQCAGEYKIDLWTKKITGKGFACDDEARKAARERIRKKVIRKANQDGVCDGFDCNGDEDDGDECLPSWDDLQRDGLFRLFTYWKGGKELHGYEIAADQSLFVTCRCL